MFHVLRDLCLHAIISTGGRPLLILPCLLVPCLQGEPEPIFPGSIQGSPFSVNRRSIAGRGRELAESLWWKTHRYFLDSKYATRCGQYLTRDILLPSDRVTFIRWLGQHVDTSGTRCLDMTLIQRTEARDPSKCLSILYIRQS